MATWREVRDILSKTEQQQILVTLECVECGRETLAFDTDDHVEVNVDGFTYLEPICSYCKKIHDE